MSGIVGQNLGRGSGLVKAGGVGADSVTGASIADDAVNSEHYTDGSIDTAHIGATQVTGAKLNTDVISAQTALASEPADTDEFMVSDAGVLKRIDYSLIKGGGITETDTWRLTTTFAGDAAPISSNLERDDTYGNGLLGTGMTQSSGIFTFPSTGYWLVTAYHNITRGDADVAYISLNIEVTTDNSTYNNAAYAYSGAMAGTIEHQSASVPKLIDVTSTTNVKVRFGVADSESGNTTDTRGSTNENRTCFVFTRLADT